MEGIMRRFAFALSLAATIHGAACSETTYEFDPVSVGEDGPARDPQPRTNTQYIRGLYTDLVGRAPESYDFEIYDQSGTLVSVFPIAEQEYLLFTLDGVGDPTPLRSLIATGLVQSDEVDLPDKDGVDDPAAWITDQFRQFLGREPNTYELDVFVSEWESDPAVGPDAVIRALVGSREYQSF
jgi:hypothetical protein